MENNLPYKRKKKGTDNESLSNQIGNLLLLDWLPPSVSQAVKDLRTWMNQQAVSVKQPPYNAVGNGITDDTTVIQDAINNHSTVYIPDGTYVINADSDASILTGGLSLRSNTTLILSPNAILKAKTTSVGQYNVIRILDKENVTVIGGVIQGDRFVHTGSTGEHGFGINIKGSKNVAVQGTVIKECWGDGIYIGKGTTVLDSENIKLIGVVSDKNRRQGLTLVRCKGFSAVSCVFSNTGISQDGLSYDGIAPMAGVDLETNAGDTISDAKFTHCYFYNNGGHGITSGGSNGAITSIITDCTSESNEQKGINFSVTNDSIVKGCRIFDNKLDGIYISGNNNLIEGNTVKGNLASGITLSSASHNLVMSNEVNSNTQYGVLLASSTYNNVSHNKTRLNGQAGVYLSGSSHNTVEGNDSSENSQATTATYANILVKSNSDYNNIQNNTCRQGSQTNKPREGINIDTSDCDNNMVMNNDCYDGGSVAGVRNIGTGTVLGAGNRNKDGTFSTTPN